MFISFIMAFLGMSNPLSATVATPSTVKAKTEVASKKKKKMTFKEKIRLIKDFRKAKKAARKASPEKAQSIFQNSMFVTGLILVGGGLVVGLLGIGGLLGWLGGLLAVIGVVLMIIALIREFT